MHFHCYCCTGCSWSPPKSWRALKLPAEVWEGFKEPGSYFTKGAFGSQWDFPLSSDEERHESGRTQSRIQVQTEKNWLDLQGMFTVDPWSGNLCVPHEEKSWKGKDLDETLELGNWGRAPGSCIPGPFAGLSLQELRISIFCGFHPAQALHCLDLLLSS